MIHEPTTADYAVGDVVQHVFWGRYATVTHVTKSLLHCDIHLSNVKVKWQPSSVRKIDD